VSHFKNIVVMLGLAICPFANGAGDAAVKPLMTRELEDIAGKEVQMLVVEYPPGGADPVHRHDAHAFVYVLEGSIVMQLKGGRETTLTPGQTFYESPGDIHAVGRNASDSRPAKFLVFLLKNSGAAAVLPP
jgi:quercetin dioxygenase-like cupin family protein